MHILEFVRTAFSLKSTLRSGWVLSDIPHPETVAEHSFGVAALCLLWPDIKGLNKDKMLKMAILHEICEVITGDIVFENGIYVNNERNVEKVSKEHEAIETLFSKLDNETLKQLVLEFLEQKSPESRFVKGVDKIEMLIQTMIYEKKAPPGVLDQFWLNSEKYLKERGMEEYYNCLLQARNNSEFKCKHNQINVFKDILKLKNVQKSAWRLKDVRNPESIASHSFGISLLSLVVPLPNNINREKLVRMAIVHEIGKLLSGDSICETGRFINQQKCKLKVESEICSLQQILPEPMYKKCGSLSAEYLQQKTIIAKYLKQLDRLEVVIQSLFYEKSCNSELCDEFWNNANMHIKDKTLRKYFEYLLNQRNRRS